MAHASVNDKVPSLHGARVDQLDLQIIRRMGIAPFLVWPHPPTSLRASELGRALKVSADTVKRRIAALSRSKIFHGTQVFPNPRLFGLRTASFHFAMSGSRRARVKPEAVAKVRGVLGVFDMVGGDRCVDLAYADEASLETIRTELSRLLEAESHHFVDYPMPRVSTHLSPLDWRILQALRARPSTTLEEAATALGLSLRTVKRRFDRMAKGGALDVIGLFDLGAVEGHLMVDLLFHLKPGAGREEVPKILNTFRSRWVGQWSPPDRSLGALALVVVARSARELEDLRREGESLSIVERCDALVLESAREDWDWIDLEIARRAGVHAPPGPNAPAVEAVVPALVQNHARAARQGNPSGRQRPLRLRADRGRRNRNP